MPKTIINKNRFVCASPSQPAIGLNTNNGGYSRDINMQLIYFTALICNPPKQTNSNKKKPSLPNPNTILKYKPAQSKHVPCSASTQAEVL